jgi:luciferase family oxidoreductase group 1
MKLSVLDQSPCAEGNTQDQAIRDSLALAQLCDDLRYHRYWVSEHHNSGSIVGTAPEILMAAVAATTRRIRVGSAGVMLPHYSALKVAEQFRVLEALAPGRIDLGVGRAPGSDRLTAFALNPHANAADEFPRQVYELQSWVAGTALPDDHPFRAIAAQPQGPTSPEIWILGSSDYGARLAAHFGLPYAFAYFFSDGAGVDEALALTGAITGRASAIRSRSRRSACGRLRRTPRTRRGGSSPRANTGASASRRGCAIRWCRRSVRARIRTRTTSVR